MEFAPSIVESNDSVLFWGGNRVTTVAAATALSQRADPSFLWLDVRGPDAEGDGIARFLSPRIPADRRQAAGASSEMAPNAAPLARSVASVVRAEEGDVALAGLIDFLRLPPAVQRLVSRRLPNGRPVTLLITGADRVAHFYLERAEFTRGYAETLKSLGVKLVVSYTGLARRDRFAFDHSFRIEDPVAEDWASAVLCTDRDDLSEGTAGFRPTRLGEIDSVCRVMVSGGDGAAE